MNDMDNFLDLFADQVRQAPNAMAASDGCATLSYQDVDEISDGFARMLSAASVKPGDIVAIGLERGFGYLASMISLFNILLLCHEWLLQLNDDVHTSEPVWRLLDNFCMGAARKI